MGLGFPGPTWWQPRDGSWVEVKGWSRLISLGKAKTPQPRDFLDVTVSPKEKTATHHDLQGGFGD